jgi:hypothetical protein
MGSSPCRHGTPETEGALGDGAQHASDHRRTVPPSPLRGTPPFGGRDRTRSPAPSGRLCFLPSRGPPGPSVGGGGPEGRRGRWATGLRRVFGGCRGVIPLQPAQSDRAPLPPPGYSPLRRERQNRSPGRGAGFMFPPLARPARAECWGRWIRPKGRRRRGHSATALQRDVGGCRGSSPCNQHSRTVPPPPGYSPLRRERQNPSPASRRMQVESRNSSVEPRQATGRCPMPDI